MGHCTAMARTLERVERLCDVDEYHVNVRVLKPLAQRAKIVDDWIDGHTGAAADAGAEAGRIVAREST